MRRFKCMHSLKLLFSVDHIQGVMDVRGKFVIRCFFQVACLVPSGVDTMKCGWV
ncbi:hypothetical protein IscW_ISCW008221 [Ixodes scapularis]|uniref:Uncharacterized protein n=1 Tax=Ixodes scapularis TaxID=6945 RepID=B7PUC6_IXOSC|nr:hypothetical protein IscW_ISCW008221 [Ixodes scapularis]|eukprot:XP_002405907.1 hypothetical protein IscW_ISCW008221 [Ixodes scapularis]